MTHQKKTQETEPSPPTVCPACSGTNFQFINLEPQPPGFPVPSYWQCVDCYHRFLPPEVGKACMELAEKRGMTHRVWNFNSEMETFAPCDEKNGKTIH